LSGLKKFEYLDELNLTDNIASLVELKALAIHVEDKAAGVAAVRWDQAESYEHEGDVSRAIEALESILGLGLPEEEKKARSRIANLEERLQMEGELERRRTEKAAHRKTLGIMGLTSGDLQSREYGTAVKRLDRAMADEELSKHQVAFQRFKKVALEAKVIWEDALKELTKLATAETQVILEVRGAEAPIRGFVGPLRDNGTVPLYHSAGRDQEKAVVALRMISSREVLELAGLGYAGQGRKASDHFKRGMFIFAEGNLDKASEEFDVATKGEVDMEGLWELLGQARRANLEGKARTVLEEADQALLHENPGKALELFENLSGALRTTYVYEANREKIDGSLVRCRNILAGRRKLEDLFEGELAKLGDGLVKVKYDFTALDETADWLLTGEKDSDRAWEIRDGLRAAGRRGRQWKAVFSGGIDLDFTLGADEAGSFTDFLRLEYEEGEYVFRLGLGQNQHRILIQGRKSEGEWVPLGTAEAPGMKGRAEFKVRVTIGADGMRLIVMDKPLIQLKKAPMGPGRLSIWGTPTAVTYLGLEIECRLDPTWVLGHNR
ncbi:MAG: hypothetical protein ACYTFG_02800, partial [Planctomycetota bacterium]